MAEKITKEIMGEEIMHIDGHDTWLTCITKSGEKVTISFMELFKLFDNYKLQVEQYGVGSANPRWRTKKFIQHSEDI